MLCVMDNLRAASHHFHGSDSKRSNRPSDTVIVTWDGPDDPQDPFNWTLPRKRAVIGLALFASFISSMNGSIISVAHEAINEEFHVSDAKFPHSYWPITSWGLGGALFSLVLFPVMEDFGTRPVFLATYFFFICLLVPIGLAQNFATLIVVRFFSGGCVQLICNAVASIITNVFEEDRARSVPISLYATVYLASTSLGPAIGSCIFQFLSWRWIGYIELIWTAALFPMLFFCLPETRGPAILLAKAKRLRHAGKKACTAEELDHVPLGQVVIRSIQRPLYMLCTELVVFVAAVWAAFSLGTIYLFTQSVEQVYRELYAWDAVQAGYVQAAIAIGEVLGCGLCALTNHWYYASAARNTEVPGTPIPEARLYGAIIGGFFGVTGGMFVYGWTSYPTIHWMAPAIGLAMVGFGTTAVVTSLANYLADAYSKFVASAYGAVGLVENTSLAFLPFAATAMYTNLGFQWASSLLAFVSLALVVTPFAVFRWGKEIRSRSPFMREAIIERQQGSTATSPKVLPWLLPIPSFTDPIPPRSEEDRLRATLTNVEKQQQQVRAQILAGAHQAVHNPSQPPPPLPSPSEIESDTLDLINRRPPSRPLQPLPPGLAAIKDAKEKLDAYDETCEKARNELKERIAKYERLRAAAVGWGEAPRGTGGGDTAMGNTEETNGRTGVAYDVARDPRRKR
ncbi:MAG: hypothetical protein M1820_005968 [Bogoriella megaspora]|nr:MAG: hypothetical protein M1820_005968 [Bogoriella megaspora]